MSNIRQKLKKQEVLHDFSLTVERGHICGLIGPNGAGKTTIMKILAGFFFPSKGELELFGSSENLDASRTRMSFMIEQPIIAGFRPHQIILGKTLVILPSIFAFLAAAAIVSLINDRSPQTVERLLIYCILCVRATLCIVFLSPLLKIGTFAPVFSVMLLMLNGSDMEAVARSPLSLLCFGQCTLLVRDITDGFVIKVIVSAVVSCAIYYLIGYFTLQKKIDLEPHKFT